MNKIIRTFLSFSLLLVLSACFPNLPQPAAVTGSLKLEVRTANDATTFSRVDEPINYLYVVHNSTSSPLQGPVTVLDGTRQIACPPLNTVGNLNDSLDVEEEIVCPYEYRITESDFNTGSVTNLATASVGGVTSNQTGITLTRVQPSAILVLAKTADPMSYGQVGQIINYSYTITNTGPTSLGPTQFVINDNKLPGPLNCGPGDTTLAPNQPITCAATYTITESDMSAPSVTNTAIASGAEQISASISVTIINSTLTATPTSTSIVSPPPSGSTCPTSQQQRVPGTTCLHQVAKGEWLIQIGRCYGVSLNELISANRQIQDPSLILPSMLLTVPNIGSAGTIHGSPCITFVTVQSGDTWESLAQRYNARVDVLQRANPGGLVVGQQARIPLNSASGGGVIAPPGATPTPTSPAGPTPAQRITIPAGQTSAPVAGVVNPMQSVSYVIAATPGQTLSVSLTGIANTEATLGVTGPTGLALKTPDGNFSWNTAVTTGGDHTITITSLIGGSSRTYTLVVGLSAPVVPATDTPTATPTTLIP